MPLTKVCSETKVYTVVVVCHNCGHVPIEERTFSWNSPDKPGLYTLTGGGPKTVTIPKGKPAQSQLDELVCEVCGCKGFIRPQK